MSGDHIEMTRHQGRHREEAIRNPRVAALLAAAAAPSEPGPLPGEDDALTAYRAAGPRSGRACVRVARARARTALAATIGAGLLVTGGFGAAMAGTLPGTAQRTAHDMLATVGVDVPDTDDHAGTHPDERGQSGDRQPADVGSTDTGSTDPGSADVGSAGTQPADRGSEVTGLARDTESIGVDKGAEISGLASGGRSQAGEQGAARPPGAERAPDRLAATEAGTTGGRADATADPQPPVEVPYDGGPGTETADEPSGGHNEAGSENRP
ncbi:MAG: hypothetical protein ACRDO2_02740 [Nocardioidaceae bacterium]